MKNKLDYNHTSYLKLIFELSDEIGISIEESKKIVDYMLHYLDSKKINYKEIKNEILSFVVINMFSFICKL
tara:strand:- start:428 stop:640 length:213 start_codon:yes stop_codon:yes gene_type:complete